MVGVRSVWYGYRWVGVCMEDDSLAVRTAVSSLLNFPASVANMLQVLDGQYGFSRMHSSMRDKQVESEQQLSNWLYFFSAQQNWYDLHRIAYNGLRHRSGPILPGIVLYIVPQKNKRIHIYG